MLAAGTRWKLFDFGVVFNGVLPGNETGDFFFFFFFFFLHFSVTYSVSFTKIICISMSHRLNIFFLHIFMKFNFLAFKKNK